MKQGPASLLSLLTRDRMKQGPAYQLIRDIMKQGPA